MEPRVLQLDDRGAGDPLVLVPGGLTGWLSWIPHQERLLDRYRVIRVQPIHNKLGSQGAPGDPGYTAQIERESLRLTLDALDLERPNLAGWSGGGLALIEFAIEYPERVRSLTLVEPGAYWILEQLGDRLDEVNQSNGFVHGLFGREVSEDELATFLRLGGLAEAGEDLRSHPNWRRWVEHRATLSWISPLLDHPERSIDDLARIAAPALVTKGTKSTPVDRRLVDVLGERLPSARVREFEGDHAHHIEQIDSFLDALERHLAQA
ncbi:MAG TPA: alpha/beta hydrolase [Candidatus Limnocylindria bacterium]